MGKRATTPATVKQDSRKLLSRSMVSSDICLPDQLQRFDSARRKFLYSREYLSIFQELDIVQYDLQVQKMQ